MTRALAVPTIKLVTLPRTVRGFDALKSVAAILKDSHIHESTRIVRHPNGDYEVDLLYRHGSRLKILDAAGRMINEDSRCAFLQLKPIDLGESLTARHQAEWWKNALANRRRRDTPLAKATKLGCPEHWGALLDPSDRFDDHLECSTCGASYEPHQLFVHYRDPFAD